MRISREVDPVQPGQTGEFEGKFPSGLVNPDRAMYAPRFGLAWRPKSDVEVDEADGGARGVWDQLQHGAVCDDGEVAVVPAAVCGDADE